MSVDKNKIIRPRRQTSWIWQYFKEVTKEIILESEEGEERSCVSILNSEFDCSLF